MTKYELLEKIAKRVDNALYLLNEDNRWCRCEEEIEDELSDLKDILYNYQGENFYCKDCLFFEVKQTLYVGEWYNCRYWDRKTRFLYTCTNFHEKG